MQTNFSHSWLDVANVPSRGWGKVRIACERFGGRTVCHCHILDHEDLGVIGIIRTS